ncbi:MAG: 3-oxoacyl-ACP synthase, partial [Bacteroidales bacterium]|nr:3-oxoacyl-ACP synthase [Bacteroidales bacterium]
MGKIRAAITGIHAWVPEYRLDNFELSRMVDTSDEWIMQRVGTRERRILKGEGLGTSDMAYKAVTGLLEKTGTSPDEIEALICATITPDMLFPATANIISDKAGIKKAFSFDLSAACSGFIFALH